MKRNYKIPHIKLRTRKGRTTYHVIKPTSWGAASAVLVNQARIFAAKLNKERENETPNS